MQNKSIERIETLLSNSCDENDKLGKAIVETKVEVDSPLKLFLEFNNKTLDSLNSFLRIVKDLRDVGIIVKYDVDLSGNNSKYHEFLKSE